MINKQYQFTVWKYVPIVVVIGAITVYVILYVINWETVVKPAALKANAKKILDIPRQSVGLIGSKVAQINQVYQTIRDPFAKLPEAQQLKNDGLLLIPNKATSKMPISVPILPLSERHLKLTGIITAANEHLAVIMWENKSKSYGLNEMIGTYKLVMITSDSIVLENTNERLLLKLEAARKKEDNHSGK